jgi:hypothetical protein
VPTSLAWDMGGRRGCHLTRARATQVDEWTLTYAPLSKAAVEAPMPRKRTVEVYG